MPEENQEAQETPLADDILNGADEIGKHIKEPTRRVFYLAARGLIPVFKVGNRLRGRKSQLDKHYSA